MGTITELLTEDGYIDYRQKLNLWGEAEIDGHRHYAANDSSPLKCNHRFVGQYYDDESELHYNRFRYYSPETGQYISHDPIGLLGGFNPYGYVFNPSLWVDPLGLESEIPDILYHYTSEAGMKGILESGVIKASTGDVHARFGSGQYFTNISPDMLGGRTIRDAAGTGKMSLGQLAGDIYGDPRKLNGISHVVEVDVRGLDITEPRPGTFRVANAGDLDVSDRIVSAGESLGERTPILTCGKQ